jgi:hypothetical protein
MGPIQTNVAAECRKFHTVVSGACYDIEAIYDITFEEFLSWNPSSELFPLQSRCSTSAWPASQNRSHDHLLIQDPNNSW